LVEVRFDASVRKVKYLMEVISAIPERGIAGPSVNGL